MVEDFSLIAKEESDKQLINFVLCESVVMKGAHTRRPALRKTKLLHELYD